METQVSIDHLDVISSGFVIVGETSAVKIGLNGGDENLYFTFRFATADEFGIDTNLSSGDELEFIFQIPEIFPGFATDNPVTVGDMKGRVLSLSFAVQKLCVGMIFYYNFFFGRVNMDGSAATPRGP